MTSLYQHSGVRPRSREMECQIGIRRGCDEFETTHSSCDLVHGRQCVKLGYVECDEYVQTFYFADSFTGDGVSNWDTSNVTDLSEHSRCDLVQCRFVKLEYVECDDVCTETFLEATSFTGDGLSNWDTSRVTTFVAGHSKVRPRSREICQIGIRRG